MSDPGFVGELRERTDAVWTAIHRHPFVRAIGDGSLGRDRLEFYLRQDHAYLVDFSRVLALAAAKSGDVETMRFFSTLLETTIHTEMELHRRTCGAFGIGAEELEEVEPGLVTLSYTNLLLRTCYEGPPGDILAVLLPCAAGYVEIATALRAAGLPGDPHCRDWIETYSSPEMEETTTRLVGWLNDTAESAAPADRKRWGGLYEASARHELLFFEMAWRMEAWPEIVPG